MDFHKINRRCIARKIQVNAIGANALSVFEHLPHHIDEANAFDALSLNGHRALGGIRIHIDLNNLLAHTEEACTYFKRTNDPTATRSHELRF